MDLSTIKSKLDNDAYTSLVSFWNDVCLVFDNAFIFNPIKSDVFKGARAVRDHFISVFKELFPHRDFLNPIRLSVRDVSKAEVFVKTLEARQDLVLPFLLPVNKRLVPEYYQAIQNPVDLGSIRRKIFVGGYSTLDDFKSEIDLMFSNCFRFNAPGSELYLQGSQLKSVFTSLWNTEFGLSDDVGGGGVVDADVVLDVMDEEEITSPTSFTATVAAAAAASTTTASELVRNNTQLEPATIVVGQPHPISSCTSTGPSALSPVVSNLLSAEELKLCQSALNTIMSQQSCASFLAPVDPVALGIPQYPIIIKNPMDLGTVKRKLSCGAYTSRQAFVADVHLVFNNCFTFNSPGTILSRLPPCLHLIPFPPRKDHFVYVCGKEMMALFDEEMAGVNKGSNVAAAVAAGSATTAVPVNLPPQQHRFVSSSSSSSLTLSASNSLEDEVIWKKVENVLNKVWYHNSAAIFQAPVDRILYPDYYVKVTNPMDLSKISAKFADGEYKTTAEVQADFKLMFANCVSYNAKGSFGRKAGSDLEVFFKKEWKGVDGGGVSSSSAGKLPAVKIALPSMPAEKQDVCVKLLKRLQLHPYAGVFMTPVPKNVPGYHAIIKKPMDLGTIERRLGDGKYGSIGDFSADVNLVFGNCMAFNLKV